MAASPRQLITRGVTSRRIAHQHQRRRPRIGLIIGAWRQRIANSSAQWRRLNVGAVGIIIAAWRLAWRRRKWRRRSARGGGGLIGSARRRK